jgi:single-stranded-DNA-specific exonuclease
MNREKKWNIRKKDSPVLSIEEIVNILLENRNLIKKDEIFSFFHPNLQDVTIETVGIDKNQLQKAIKRIEKAKQKKEKIAIFGDYDVDGITGTAVLWETLYKNEYDVIPYIPHRVDEGYGLSIKGIENLLALHHNIQLIISVDNGIVANDAVLFAKKYDIDVIITDHHTIGESLPKAHAIVHTTKLCGAGVAWMISQELQKEKDTKHLDIVALATVADMVPLTGANRILLTEGLSFLQKTNRPGLHALFEEAGIDAQKEITTYHIGHIIGPRLNAMGRMESAMDSLRLLCTINRKRANDLATHLATTNKERQLVTQKAAMHAIEQVKNEIKRKNLLFVSHETYEEGVIGLIAGKLVETFYRPSIVIAKKEKVSKGSARSIAGCNIIEFLRKKTDLLVNVGGHPMAAGFTIETAKIVVLQEALEKLADEIISSDMLIPVITIDCKLSLSQISQELFNEIKKFAPFGIANPEPVFCTKDIIIHSVKAIGRDKNHLKLQLQQHNSSIFDAIAFGMGRKIQELKTGSVINAVYTIDENEWNGKKNLQLKIKDIQYSL